MQRPAAGNGLNRRHENCETPLIRPRQLQRQLESQLKSHDGRVEISLAIAQFRKELERLNREEATLAKYNLTLSRLLQWCSTQAPMVLLSGLDIPTHTLLDSLMGRSADHSS